MSHLPIESLRCGGDPHPLPPEPIDPVWDPYDSDGEPKISSIGGAMIFAPELVDIQTCGRCGAELVSKQFLRLHMEQKHGQGGD